MDLNSFRSERTGPDFSNATVSSVPSRLLESLKFDPRNSPTSHFSTHFDTDNLTPCFDSQEQYSSTDNISSNSTLDSHLIRSAGSFVQNLNYNRHVRNALQELETALMAPDDEEVTTSKPFLAEHSESRGRGPRSMASNQESQESHSHQSQESHNSRFGNTRNEPNPAGCRRDMEDFALQGTPPNNLRQLLIACALALSNHKIDEFEKLVVYARSIVSVIGEPIQRLGAYMIEGLVARKELSGTNIYRALKCDNPDSKDLLSYMHILYEICPYLKFGHMAANGAIAEACKNEDHIHIIDFQIAQGTQWMTLLQALAARPGGAPHVRITGIDDPVSQHARGGGLAAIRARFAAVSEKFNIPIEFHAVPVYAADITRAMLNVRPGEALVVNFPLQLHHTPDESVDVSNPRDGLLRMIKSLSPTVVTLVEQESNTNTAPFVQRFIEALDFYTAMFESIDVTIARDRKERIKVEEHCLARDIVNIIACEGRERVERHELLGKWRLRFMMAGFRQFPLSSYVNSVIRGLLKQYSEHYTLLETDGAMLLGWKDRYLVSASAWY
ncbi:chitin-inducible gibberellin-responsive protein 1-like [Dorcoceras hygrometricum]|uniref:Chitin-inducible gibberellin-responsive protein 1-like n=1 Tax=Dorcoceras hygrometricum TaxID=472368 RepID=A0A2Z7CNK8_9LAMI|nr:chitin-inducible gibberellin-responsive protein 1-like [Dorcoceras hygrometricum]